MKILKSTLVLSLGLCSYLSAATIQTLVPTVSVSINGGLSPTIYTGVFNADGKTFALSGGVTGVYNFMFSGNTDPLINFGFTASTPGTYSVPFFLPVAGGPYNFLRNQGSVTISDGDGPGTGNPTTVTNVSFVGQVPTGTAVPGVTLTGNASAANGGVAFLAYGPASVTQNFGSPTSFEEILTFTLTSLDKDGTASFAGQLQLTNVATPEPGTMLLFGIGLVAVAGIGSRRFRKV